MSTNNLGIKIGINTSDGIKLAKASIDNFIKSYQNKKIKLHFDTSEINSIKSSIDNFGQSINKVLNTNVSKGLKNGLAKTQTYTDALGKPFKIIETNIEGIGKKTIKIFTVAKNQAGQLEKKLQSKQAVNDYEKIAKHAKQVQESQIKTSENATKYLNKYKQTVAKLYSSSKNQEILKLNPNITKEFQSFFKSLKSASQTDIANGKFDQSLKQIINSFAVAKNKINNMTQAEKEALDLSNKMAQAFNRLGQMGSSETNNVLFNKDSKLLAEFDGLNTELTEFNTKVQNGQASMKDWTKLNFNQKINNLSSSLQVAKNKMGSFTATIVANLKAFLNWYVIGNVVASVKRTIVGAFEKIVELNSAMVELKKVTDETNDTYNEYYLRSNDIAKALGVTTKEVIDATTAWSQMGYAIEEASRLAEASSIFSNISEDMGIDDSTSTLVSTIKAFKIDTEDALDGIISKVNSVGNAFAITNSDIAEILSKSSASMAVANNSLEQTIALGTAAQEIVRDAGVVGKHKCLAA